jgi:hypothetical protein
MLLVTRITVLPQRITAIGSPSKAAAAPVAASVSVTGLEAAAARVEVVEVEVVTRKELIVDAVVAVDAVASRRAAAVPYETNTKRPEPNMPPRLELKR